MCTGRHVYTVVEWHIVRSILTRSGQIYSEAANRTCSSRNGRSEYQEEGKERLVCDLDGEELGTKGVTSLAHPPRCQYTSSEPDYTYMTGVTGGS